MALSTYSDLVSSIEDWLMRDDLPAASLIALAEAQFNRQLRLRQMIKRSTATVDSGYEGLPADFLQVRRLTVDGWPLRPVTPEQAAAFTAAATAGDTPQQYAIVGAQIQIAPAPTSGTLELVYYARLTALSADNPTTGLFEWAPDLYLYASLLQAAPYLRDDARVPIWLAAYDTLVQQLIAADSAADYPSGLTIQTEGTVY